MTARRAAGTTLAVVAGLAVGWTGGRLTAPPQGAGSRAGPRSPAQLAASGSTAAAELGQTTGHGRPPSGYASPPRNARAHPPRPAAPPTPGGEVERRRDDPAGAVNALLARVVAPEVVVGAGEDDSDALREAAALALNDLIAAASGDTAALHAVLDRLRRENDARTLEVLAAVAGTIHDPAVERTALDLLGPGQLHDRRLAALSILDALDTEAALTPIHDLLGWETDPRVLGAAVQALPPAGRVASDRAAPVIERLTAFARARDGDPTLRHRAVVALGDYGSTTDLSVVVEALATDPDPAVRAGAAHALWGRRDTPPNARALLTRVVADPAEDGQVRELAWHTLGSLGPLDPEARAAREAFAIAREGGGEH